MIISLVNQKGGVGKTASAVQISSFLAKKGYKTLLIDNDGQKTATIATLQKDDVEVGLFESLTNPAVPLPIYPLPQISENLFLVPSTKKMYGFDVVAATMTRREDLLKKKLAKIKPYYDFIIIDCAPNKSLAAQNALTASDYVLIPTQAEPSSYVGLLGLIETIEIIREDCNESLKVLGIFFTMYNERLSISKSVKEAVIGLFGDDVLSSTIRVNVALKECQLNYQSIFDYAPTSNGAKDYENLTNEILERIKAKIP